MIYFYRLIQPFKAITFDLDDTLYDNRLVIKRAEKKLIHFLNQSHPKLLKFTHQNYQFYRKQLLLKYPKIYFNISDWRQQSILLSIKSFGIESRLAILISRQAMSLVNFWRNQINISTDTHYVLKLLSAKLPLIAITNGDANMKECNINQYFSEIFRSGVNGPPKPYANMYDLAAKKLNLLPNEILHIGDSLNTDVLGAINYGMQACWLNICKKSLLSSKNARVLPHFETSNLIYLKNFV